MIWAFASPDEPPPVEEFQSTLSPPGAVFPMICHCCVGAAFHRTMPPNRFSARLSLASVAVFDGVGCVVAAVNGTTTLVRALMLGNSPPSEFGAARAVAELSSVLALARFIAA